MNFASVCTGIGAPEVAWASLGWSPLWFAEIEPFPSSVLAHRFPRVPNLGDMTTIASRVRADEVAAPDVLVGGTPCQAFSVAGLRGGLADPRGALTLSFVDLANAIDDARRARREPECTILWENVPGVLSSKDNAFGCFLGALAGSGCELQPAGKRWPDAGCVFGPQRAIAWRVLDAQYFGVAQRRRRVFVVASAREGFDPAAVLFEFDGVRRDTAPSREAGKVAPTIPSRSTGGGGGLGTDFDCDGGVIQTVVGSLACNTGPRGHDAGNFACNQAVDAGHVLPIITMAHGQGGAEIAENRSPTLTCNHEAPIAAYGIRTANTSSNGWGIQEEATHTLDGAMGIAVAHSLRGEGFDASEDGTGRGQPIVPAFSVALRGREGGATAELGGDVAGCLRASTGGGDKPHVLAFHGAQDPDCSGQVSHPLGRNGGLEACIAFDVMGTPASEVAKTTQVHTPLRARVPGCVENSTRTVVSTAMLVRRITPREGERLQGFPDDWTLVPYGANRAKDFAEWVEYLRLRHAGLTDDEARRLAADGPRYKAIGNSMAVPCMRWLGWRIASYMAANDNRPKPGDLFGDVA